MAEEPRSRGAECRGRAAERPSVAHFVREVQLGASIADLYEEFLMHELAMSGDKDLSRILRGLDVERRREVHEAARRFTGELCRRLGDLHSGDTRICSVLEEWVWKSKDYDAFDALLSSFEFPGRQRVLEEGRRLFPSALTAHW